MKKVLITGCSGFAGSYLAEALLLQGDVAICGTSLSSEMSPNLKQIANKIEIVAIDLQKKDAVSSLLKKVQPDFIYHLAALTSPRESFDHPEEIMINNISVELHILEGLRKNNLSKTRILITSSAEVYGKVSQEDLPIDENTKFMPTSPYAVSKIAQDYLALQYFLSYNFPIVRVRPFNHIGPRQSPMFVVSAFAKQIAEIEKNKKEPKITVGDLDTKRDFTDVRDMVIAYSLALEKGTAGDVYNIGSGTSHKISSILEKLLALSTVKNIQVEENSDRPGDNPDLQCDSRKFTKLTGWKPKILIDTTIKDTLDYWRNIL